MTRILQAVAKALRMAGVEHDLDGGSPLSEVEATLEKHGLGLAVVEAERSPDQIGARWLTKRAYAMAAASGEPEWGLGARIGKLIGRDQSRVNRALDGAATLDDAAKQALEAHLLDPQQHPLPPKEREGRPPGSTDWATAAVRSVWGGGRRKGKR